MTAWWYIFLVFKLNGSVFFDWCYLQHSHHLLWGWKDVSFLLSAVFGGFALKLLLNLVGETYFEIILWISVAFNLLPALSLFSPSLLFFPPLPLSPLSFPLSLPPSLTHSLPPSLLPPSPFSPPSPCHAAPSISCLSCSPVSSTQLQLQWQVQTYNHPCNVYDNVVKLVNWKKNKNSLNGSISI